MFLKSPIFSSSEMSTFKNEKTTKPHKKTIIDETAITYLNAFCLSSILAVDISVVISIEKIITPITPIEDATIPLPPSRKLNVLPCFFLSPYHSCSFYHGSPK